MIMQILAFPSVRRSLFVTLLLLFISCPARARRKDVVVMNNGDHFIGEVKRLKNGLLMVETDYVTGPIALDWNQVESVQSTSTFQIVLNNEKRLVGTFEKVSGDKTKEQDFLIREATE